MKKSALLFAFLLSGCFVFGQLSFGPKMGINLNKLSTDMGENVSMLKEQSKSGLQFGAFARLGGKTYFQPEIMISGRGGKFNFTPTGGSSLENYEYSITALDIPLLIGNKIFNTPVAKLRIFAGPVAVNGKLYRKLQFRYLEIPLLFKMKTREFNNGIRYFGQMGLVPAFNLRTRADDVFYPDGGQSIKNSPDVSYSINAIKLSVDVGGGFEIPFDKSTFMMIGLTYSNGFTDLLGGYNNHPLVRAQEEAIQHYLELTFAIIF